MNLTEPPPSKPSDELDDLLRAFFRSQMPHSWPAPRQPAARVAPSPRPSAPRRSLNRSRWALAASIGLLLVGSFSLPGRLTPSNSEAVPGGPMTSDNELRRKMQEEHKRRHEQPRHHPGVGDVGGSVPELEDF
jgi:hypothetical protein